MNPPIRCLCLGTAVGALWLAGCGPKADCEEAAGARVCVETSGSQVNVRGVGFAPGSAARVTFPDESGIGPLEQSADAEGRVPPFGGAVITSLTDDPRRMVWDGTSTSGETVHVELILPAR